MAGSQLPISHWVEGTLTCAGFAFVLSVGLQIFAPSIASRIDAPRMPFLVALADDDGLRIHTLESPGPTTLAGTACEDAPFSALGNLVLEGSGLDRATLTRVDSAYTLEVVEGHVAGTSRRYVFRCDEAGATPLASYRKVMGIPAPMPGPIAYAVGLVLAFVFFGVRLSRR